MRSDGVPMPLDRPRLEQLERELTDPRMERLRRFAEQRVLMQKRSGVVGYDDPKHEAEILVQNAITLTILGNRCWRDDLDLYDHLCGVIRSESSAEVRRVAKRGETAFDPLALDQSHHDEDNLETPRRGVSSHRGLRSKSLAEAVRHVTAPLRALTAHDDNVDKLIDAYESGCSSKKEVRAVTALSHDEYRSARRKLDRLLAKLPEPLTEGVRDALEISYG
jgi:hypothetical protein